MNKQFVKIGIHIINVNQITHIHKCGSSVSISITTSSTVPTGELEADYILIKGEDAITVWAYFSSMMISHTLIKESNK